MTPFSARAANAWIPPQVRKRSANGNRSHAISADHEASRDLVIIRKDKTAVISSPAPLSSPAIYEFHVAHK